LFKKYRQKSRHHNVICCIAVCDWLFTVSWWFPVIIPSSHSFCIIQAFALEVFAVAAWVWPSIFAVRLLLSNMFELEPTRNWTILSHLIGWGFSFCLAVYCGAAGMYGPSGLWCWITNDHPGAQIFLGDGIVVIAFIIELTVFSMLMWSMNRGGLSKFGALRTEMRTVTLRMSLFLLIPPVCWSWALVDRLYAAVNGSQLYWLEVVHAVMATSQGFLNAMLYGWDPELMHLWADLMKNKSLKAENSKLLNALPEDNESAPFIDVKQLYAEHEQN